jgi:hypothetical protein
MPTNNKFGVVNGLAPDIHPYAVSFPLAFSATNQRIVFDAGLDGSARDISDAQSMYIDNSANPFPVSFNFPAIGFNIVIPPTSCGVIPLITPQDTIGFSATSLVGSARTVTIVLLNIPMPISIWSAVAPASSTAAQTVINQNYTTNFLQVPLVAAAAATMILTSANAARGWVIKNQGSNPIWVGPAGVTDATGFLLNVNETISSIGVGINSNAFAYSVAGSTVGLLRQT